MKKVLSFLLIFMFSLTVLGISQDVSADAVDVTIYLHIHEYDGDYTGTNTGVWDGVNWNDYADAVSSEDSFGGVIELAYTAAEIAAVADSIELKPNTDATTAADGDSLLAPGNGQVFLDVVDLKAGSAAGTQTELHAYFIEGAKDLYVPADDRGLIFVVYADPTVAADETAYDLWNVWTWNNGSGGSADGVDFALDIELSSGGYDIPMKLAVLEVDDTADQDSGFIVRTEDWAKQCGNDITIDNTTVRGSGTLVYFYQAGSCDLETDYNAWLTDVATKYEMNSGNRFSENTIVSSPSMITVEMIMPKKPEDLVAERFMVKDANGVMIPIESITYPVTALGSYESDVTIQSETSVVVFVETAEVHADLGIAGNFQGWSPENAVTTMGDDINGYAVFEFTTFESSVEFVILVENGVDDVETLDVDESTVLSWGDTKISHPDNNIVVDLSAGGTVEVYFNDTDDSYATLDNIAQDVDITAYTYTSGVTCAGGENLFTLFLDTELDHTMIGLVGSIQVNDWTPGEAIVPTGETDEGLVVFEVCMTDTNVEYKVLYNDGVDNPETTEDDESGFNWGDRELVTANTVVDFGEGTTDGEIAHLINGSIMTLGDYEPTLTPNSVYLLSVYMTGDVDWTKVGIVGNVQANDWTPAEAIVSTKTDAFGNHIFDIELDAKSQEYLVLYDANDNGFDWDDKISGDANIAVELGAESSLVQYAMIDAEMAMTFTDIGVDIEGIQTTTVELNFAEETLKFGKEYMVYYTEVVDPEEMIMSEVLEFGVSLNFEPGMPVEGMGTYAVTPTEVVVEFQGYTPVLENLMLVNQFGQELIFQTYGLAEMLGTYTSTNTCDTDKEMIYIHLATDMEYDLAQLGLVGTINGWDIGNTIPAVGMDSEGNYVFEVCVWDIEVVQPLLDAAVTALDAATTAYDDAVAAQALVDADVESTQQEKDDAAAVTAAALTAKDDAQATKDAEQAKVDNATGGEFKVKYDPDTDGFTWDGGTDPELTPGNVAFTVADGPNYLVVEGASALDSSMNHVIIVADWKPLLVENTYKLKFIDENGFDVFVDLDIDNEAPVVDFAVIPDVAFEINNDETELDLLDYYTKIQFLDNREGELAYEFVTNIDFDVIGEQTVTIKAVDMWMNEATFDIMITVVDVIAPELTIDDAMTFNAGEEEPDWTMYATTNEGTITVDDSQVDMDNAGTFYVTYTAEDEAGNTSTDSLEVTIEAVEEPEPADTGCFGSFGLGSSIVVLVAALGGAALFFVRKK